MLVYQRVMSELHRKKATSSKSKRSDHLMSCRMSPWPDPVGEDQMLSKMMGFSAFDSSKGRDHSGNPQGQKRFGHAYSLRYS